MVDATGRIRRKRKPGQALAPPPPSRYQAFINGEMTVADLDDEEIYRMQLRDKNGEFTGRPPKSLPREFLLALREEQGRRFTSSMAAKVTAAEKTLDRLMDPNHIPGASDAVAFKAAQMVIERFGGKTPENINIQAAIEVKGWDALADDVLVDIDEEEEEDHE